MMRTLQDILKHRQQEEFVGREEQLAFFRRNLRYEPDDDRRRFVINISGQGGVGKTWLLRRFRKIVEEYAVVTAYPDEAEDDVPSMMGRIAAQFDAQGYPLKTFAERYKVYRQRRQEIEADPDAPQGFPAFLGRTLAKGGLRLARRVPVGGVAADFVDEEAFASLAGDFASYVARKIHNKDDVRLVLEPTDVLTRLLLADLREVAEKHRIALFFDTYEHAGDFLDPWLRDLLEGRHGDVPANILLMIAGRDELDRNQWSPYKGLLACLPLEPFTEEEARDYLTRKGIIDEQVTNVILYLSGRLPLLVATLAAESPDDPDKVGDPSGEAVERFLKWVEDPKQRQVALAAALPRRLNRDVLAVLVGETEADNLFTWLTEMPFVEKQGDGWAYHDVVRTQMLRYKRQEAPKGWADLHRRLAEYYEGLRDGLGLKGEVSRRDEVWQVYALEVLYHRLCQAPQQNLPEALNGFLVVLKTHRAFGGRWAETVHQAGKDVASAESQNWGEQLVEGWTAYEKRSCQVAISMFTALLDYLKIEEQPRQIALRYRGEAYLLTERYDKALEDTNCAIDLDSEDVIAINNRGAIYLLMGRNVRALADFNLAIALDPDNPTAICNQGETYRRMGRYKAAVDNLTKAIELAPGFVVAIVNRGLTYYALEHYEQALADFARAVELDPENAWAVHHRATAYLTLWRYEAALYDFNQVIELDPQHVGAIANRGETYKKMGQYEKALSDFNRALELAPDFGVPLYNRGITYMRIGLYGKALTDFDQLLELDPSQSWHWYWRGLARRALGQRSEAQADFTAAVHASTRILERDPLDWYNVFNLALCKLAIGQVEELEHLEDGLYGSVSLYQMRNAIWDLDNFLVFFPNHAQALAIRGLLREHL